MFDIGFSELLVIGIVALLVIGPERLPKVARTAGHLFGRMQRYVTDLKADINREMHLDELNKLQEEFRQQAASMEQTVAQEARQTEQQLKAVAEETAEPVRQIAAAVREEPPAPPLAAESASPQFELPLEPPASPPAEKQS